MANPVFIADTSIPGLGMAELSRRAADSLYSGDAGPLRDKLWRRALRGLDRGLLRDIGLDGSAS